MIKIALFGYGKMGKLIEQVALKRGHTIELIINQQNRDQITAEDLKGLDVAIDFSRPDAAIANMALCFEAGVPIVVGTTGWHEHLEEIKEICLSGNNSMLYGSNFSVGVNVLFYVNKLLAKAMEPYKSYDVQVEEIHHTHKLDAPSGTAITLADGILANNESKSKWINNIVGEEEEKIPKPEDLLVESHRIDEVPGTHTVIYSSEIDQIELRHIAHNRKGFAFGAVMAAEWLKDKKGFFEVGEMFNFNK